MKKSGVQSKLSKLTGKAKPAVAPASGQAAVAAPPAGAQPAAPSHFPVQVAIVAGMLHIFFLTVLTVSGFNHAILAPCTADYLVRLIELPGALLVDVIGQGENIDSFIPYIIVFVINTLFYVVIGLGLGHLLLKFKINEEIKTILNTEEE